MIADRILLPALLATALVAPAQAQSGRASTTGPAPVLNVGTSEHAIARKLDLSIGRSIVVELPRDAKEVFVANPKVANAVVRSTRKIFLIGIADGQTSVFVFDAEGRQMASLDVEIGRDMKLLSQMLRTAMPRVQVQATAIKDTIVLTGTVDSAAEAKQAEDIAKGFVGVSGNGPTGPVTGQVINSITIRGKDQVMLKVTVAEVQRTILKQLGINTFGEWNIGKFRITPTLDNPFPVQPQALSESTIQAGIGQRANFNLRAFERAGVVRTLAEPTLTAISGETAKFTAGGEIPVPKGQQCSVDQGGTPINCVINLEFKPYGVSLLFTPVVLSAGRISMRVATEVTDVDAENQIKFNNLNVPGFRVRKSDTTIELPSGGSLVSAGLIQQQTKQIVNGLPGIMDIPILGTLFRSRDYQRQESELMIIVTPYIAKPNPSTEIARPDEGFVDATDQQTVLLGRLNKIYGVAGAPNTGTRYRGQIGFITD